MDRRAIAEEDNGDGEGGDGGDGSGLMTGGGAGSGGVPGSGGSVTGGFGGTDQCAGITCPEGTSCSGGTCLCGTRLCNPDEVCSNGSCAPRGGAGGGGNSGSSGAGMAGNWFGGAGSGGRSGGGFAGAGGTGGGRVETFKCGVVGTPLELMGSGTCTDPFRLGMASVGQNYVHTVQPTMGATYTEAMGASCVSSTREIVYQVLLSGPTVTGLDIIVTRPGDAKIAVRWVNGPACSQPQAFVCAPDGPIGCDAVRVTWTVSTMNVTFVVGLEQADDTAVQVSLYVR